MNKGVYLKYILDRINGAIDTGNGRYYIATNVKSGYAKLCVHPNFPLIPTFAEEWEGEAIIYDSKQVNFVPAWPIDNADPPFGCSEWPKHLETYYEFSPKNWYNDCLTKKNERREALVSRAIFEFPKGSRHFFNFYNTHLHPREIPKTVEYIEDRQNSFRTDLKTYLQYLRVPVEDDLKMYPPLFAGDMNTHEVDECEHPDYIWSVIRRHFLNAPHDAYDPPESILQNYENFQTYLNSPEFLRIENGKEKGYWPPSKHRIDKVWVGKGGAIWDHDVMLNVVRPSGKREPFTTYWHGYSITGNNQRYSDHSPAMVEISPPMRADPDDINFGRITGISYKSTKIINNSPSSCKITRIEARATHSFSLTGESGERFAEFETGELVHLPFILESGKSLPLHISARSIKFGGIQYGDLSIDYSTDSLSQSLTVPLKVAVGGF